MIETVASKSLEVAGAARRERPRRSGRRRLEAAYEEHSPSLSRLAFLLTGDAGLAEDLVQEAFVRTFARLIHVRRPDALGPYLRRTVVNLAATHFRRSRAERAWMDRAKSNSRFLAVESDVELRELLWSALRQLPQRQRAALVLRFYEDLSEREAARLLGCRVGTVKSLVHRGLAAMRLELERGDWR